MQNRFRAKRKNYFHLTVVKHDLPFSGVPVLCRRRGAGVARWLAAAAVAGKKWRNKERRARGKDDNETLRRKPRLGSSEGGRKKREGTLASAKWKREKRCKDKGGREQG